jgi:hypothetical protein
MRLLPLYSFVLAVILPGASTCLAGPILFTTVSFPGSNLTVAEAINNSGTLVGFYDDAGGNTHGFSLAGGVFSTLDFAGADATFAKDINAGGMVVGDAVFGGNDVGFLLSGGSFSAISVPGADSTDAAGINDTGQITGSYQTGGAAHGFLSSGGSFTFFDVPGADDTVPGGMNDAGQIVGSYDIGGVNHGFLFSGGSFTTLDFPGVSDTFLTGINDLGQITGFYFDSSGSADGFVYSGGSFIGVDYPGALDTYLKGGNDTGTYVGFYDFGGDPLGFTAQMTPEPGTMALLLIGILCWFGWQHRGFGFFRAAVKGARLIGLAAALLAVSVCLQAQSPSVSFVYPVDNQIVGGTNQLLYAASSDMAGAESVVFDVSLDGVSWTALLLRSAPDYGVGSYTTGVDLTQFAVGPVYFRARFDTDSTGAVIVVQNRRLPSASCKVSRLSSLSDRFDCSASTDSNGGIVSYAFDFGDGTSTVSATPTVTHSYPSFGVFPLAVTVTDSVGLSSTSYKQLLHLQVDLIQDEPKCGCDQMTVSQTGNSMPLDDPRRFEGVPFRGMPMPLGPDPYFISYNFQITADLTKGSDPSKCTEGQQARGSQGFAGYNPSVKGACTIGNIALAKCSKNADCDVFPGLGGGICTFYPDNGPNSPRGNDDYTSPFDLTPKAYVPPSQIVWIDAPGAGILFPQPVVAADKGPDYNLGLDFRAFVNTDFSPGKSCSCHFTVNLQWSSGNGGGYLLPATFMTLVHDDETYNCVMK